MSRVYSEMLADIKNFKMKNLFVLHLKQTKHVIYGVCALIFLCLLFSKNTKIEVIIGCIGLVFTKLDTANYHRSLFESRYDVFNKCDYILSCCFQEKTYDGQFIDWKLLSRELDSFYRRSYFLFGKETYAFLTKFRKYALIHAFGLDARGDAIMDKQKIEAREFLSVLLNKQNLSEHFKELKIDSY